MTMGGNSNKSLNFFALYRTNSKFITSLQTFENTYIIQ